ncbi:MAG: SRPBCC family protein [Planctomycetales bacterium]|nr:SRPBCC family protein [Planctomycetales bacterium]
MRPIVTARKINAPKELVFKAIADIRNFSKAVPEIIRVEFLSEQHYGIGTRFRETRRMGRRETHATLEVSELVENEHIRLLSDEGGTIWDTLFEVEGCDQQSQLRLSMQIKPHSWLAFFVMPLIRGMVSSAVERDMDSICRYCEQSKTSGLI